MPRGYTRTLFNRPALNRKPSNEKSAKKVLGISVAVMSDMMGEDEAPSKTLLAIAALDEVDEADLEIVQDSVLFGRDVQQLIIDNMGNPQAFAQALVFAALEAGLEIKTDIENATK